jgi:hypothetical protein
MRCTWLAALAIGACTTQPPPPSLPDAVATFHVTVDGDGSVDPKSVRLAIAWWTNTGVWPARLIEPQELFITQHSLSWPLTIDALLTERPTYDPYWSADTVGVRPGRLIAYVDGNGNGKLDFTDITANAFTDRMLAYSIWNQVHYYTTVDSFSQQIDAWNDHREVDAATPVELYDRSSPKESCHLLADWRTFEEYAQPLQGQYNDPNDPHHGPWEGDVYLQIPCPGGTMPADTTAVSCDYVAPSYAYDAEATADASPFIMQTCGQPVRVCYVRREDPSAPGPWPCPCDSTMYTCLPDGSI